MMRKQLLFFLLFGIGFLSYAQKGTISGKILDKEMKNEALPFANVTIKGTTTGTTSNEKGEYTLNVNAGKVTVIYSFLGYKSEEVILQVKEGKNTVHNQALGSDSMMLKDVEVVTVKRKNTEAALVMEMKEAKQVISAISAEQMSKGTDANAAEAIQRVPGVTIVDGRYVMIRGLSQRYNNVLINRAIAPSTEIDMKTFSFDLIPTSSIEKIIVYKTGSPNIPGDMAGGIIDVTTSENTKEYTNVGLTLGYVPESSFNDFVQTNGSKTDFLGFDNGYRLLPNSFPDSNSFKNSSRSSDLRENAAHSLRNNFTPIESKASLNTSVGVGIGRKFDIGSVQVSTDNTIKHSTSYLSYQRLFRRYFSLNEGQERPQDWLNYTDSNYNFQNKITLLSNWKFRFNDKYTITFKNLFNQIGREETIIRNGQNYQQKPDDEFRNYSMFYNQRSILSSQLGGNFRFNDKNSLVWVLSFNNVLDVTPDWRRFRTFRPLNTDANFTIIDPPSSNLFDTSRFFGESNEYNLGNGADYTYTIDRSTEEEEFAPYKIKAGYLFDYRNKTFDARYFSYTIPGYIDQTRKEELLNLPLNTIFNTVNVNKNNGWVLEEGTRPIDKFSGTNTYLAGYLLAELPFKKFDINVGVRFENNIQELIAKDDTGNKNVTKNTSFLLPSLNVSYVVNEKNQLRFAYSRTLNRPEFREIAPFLFYDFVNDRGVSGNPLEVATIDNFDIRYEIYPRKGEIISLGIFNKQFINPIEVVAQITTEQPQFIFRNAEKAFSRGVEFEFRKSFNEIFKGTFLEYISTNINASYILSEVNLGATTSQQQIRALQGQSPYVVNVALDYTNKDNGITATAVYNRFGNRIDTVGDIIFPSIYELSRDNIDFSIAKEFKKFKIKLSVRDLLNAPFRFYEDSDRNEIIEKSRDNVVSEFRRGSLFEFSLTYKL